MKKLFLFFSITSLLYSCASGPSEQLKKAELFYTMGTNHMMKKEYTHALANLKKAAELSPDDSRILNNLAMAYYFRDSKANAYKFLTKAIKLDPKNSDARNNLASLYLEDKNYELAEFYYRQSLDDLTYLNQFRTYYNLGVIELNRGNKGKAKEMFLRSSQENVNYCPAFLQLGELAYDAGSYQESYKHYRDASMGVCHNNPLPIFKQGLALIKLQQFSLAQEKFEQVASRFSTTSFATQALKKISEIKEASRYPEAAKDIFADYQSKSDDQDKVSTSTQNNNSTLFSPHF